VHPALGERLVVLGVLGLQAAGYGAFDEVLRRDEQQFALLDALQRLGVEV
jgi:hypothetical protein